MRITSNFLTFAFLITLVANAAAQAPPTKKVRIFNNTPGPLYVFIQSPARFGSDTSDLWMQAQFKVDDWDENFKTQRTFKTTRLYRAYFEVGATTGGLETSTGIAPNQWIEITVPFYTQLKTVTSDNLGKEEDQFIDWWNAVRIYLLDSEPAYHSAKVTNSPATTVPGGGLPQPTVNPVGTAAVPTCTSSDQKPCSVLLREAAFNIPFGIPFELQEYTFAAAEGPPLNKNLPSPTRTKIDLNYVNYNVSSLDSVFLPVAIGPLTNNKENNKVPYVGTTMSVDKFRKALTDFSNAGDQNLGDGWPWYVPAYFYDKRDGNFPSTMSAACRLFQPLPGSASYNTPSIPGARFVIEESYKDPPPVPPIMSSNPADWRQRNYPDSDWKCVLGKTPPFVDPPVLGVWGKEMVTVWDKCINTRPDIETCNQIRNVDALFKRSYQKNCKGDPSSIAVMIAVYGWTPVRFEGCAGADLQLFPEFAAAQKDYCSLQYNYLTLPNAEAGWTFNPYTKLIHGSSGIGGLESSSYAFSIDDKLSFKSVPAEGLIIAVGGAKGLENETPTPLPTKDTIFEHCKTP
jgi:hypothetical protein